MPPSLEQSVTSYLSSRHCRPRPEWIRTQLPSNEHDQTSTQYNADLLYQMWLKLDWADEQFKAHSLPALPPDIHRENVNLRPKTLTGHYLVQVTHIINISKPRSKDLEEIADVDEGEEDDDGNENDFGKLFKKGAKKKGPAKGGKGREGNKRVTDQKRFSRFGTRMLRLAITDGHVQSLAIEYVPIPTLTVDGHVNSKLLLSGPFEVRAGTFLLRPQNVKVVYMAPVGLPGWWNSGGVREDNNNENNQNLQNGNNHNHQHLPHQNGNGEYQNNSDQDFDALLEDDDWDDLDNLLA